MQSNVSCSIGEKIPEVHTKKHAASGIGKPIQGIAFVQGHVCTWWIIQKNVSIRYVPLGEAHALKDYSDGQKPKVTDQINCMDNLEGQPINYGNDMCVCILISRTTDN